MITGSLVKRGPSRFAIVLEHGRVRDPKTGLMKRKQQWVSFRPPQGTNGREAQKLAEAKLAELVNAANKNEFVSPSKLLFVDFLRTWFKERVEPTGRPSTCNTYRNVIERHVANAPLGALPIQRVTADAIETYYLGLSLSSASIDVHHAVLSAALKVARKKKLISTNPMADVDRTDRTESAENGDVHSYEDVRENSWDAAEARRFLAAAKASSPQVAAFFAVALDSGARKGELFGVTWDRLDLDARTLLVDRQLAWQYGTVAHAPLKTYKKRKKGTSNGIRTITLAPETVSLLRAHRAAQATLKMKNRTTYEDRGFVFAVEPEHQQKLSRALGDPLTTLDRSCFQQLIKAADVRRIRFHGLRHTSASLLLAAGVPVNDVSKRLGHARASMTLDVYGHVLTGAQETAASRIGAALYGG